MSELPRRHNYRRCDTQTFGAAREATVIEAHEFCAMAAGQQVQGIGEIQALGMPGQSITDTRPFLDANIGQTKQMLDNPDEILCCETIERSQDPFEFEDRRQGHEHLGGFGQKTMRNRALLGGLGISRVIHVETRQDVGVKGDHLRDHLLIPAWQG